MANRKEFVAPQLVHEADLSTLTLGTVVSQGRGDV